MAARGMKRIDGGTRVARKIDRRTCLDPRKRNRSIEYAASTEAASEKKVDTADTSKVFHSQAGNAVSKIRCLKGARVGATTQNGFPDRDSSSLLGFTDVMAIQ